MRGSLRDRSSGSWELRHYLGTDPATDRKQFKSQTFRGNRRKAQKEPTKIVGSLNTGSYVEPTKETVGAYRTHRPHDCVDAPIPRASTRRICHVIVERHLIPALGHVPRQPLFATLVQEHYAAQLKARRLDKDRKRLGKPLARTTVAIAPSCRRPWSTQSASIKSSSATSPTPWTCRRSSTRR